VPALVNAVMPASEIVTDIARPVAEVSVTADEDGENLHLGLGESHCLQCLLVEARDDPVQPGNAHAEAGATNLRGEVIRDRVLLHARPESG
jgi:hypothetical protein